jgi:hypothetical protein
MAKNTKVDKELARQVKEMLWRGKSQEHVSVALGVSQSSISRIKLGVAHGDIPWPSGEMGSMPLRVGPIEDVDWSIDAKRYLTFPAEMQSRILEAVNDARQSFNAPLVPTIAPRYATFLNSDPEDAEFEATALLDARRSEDDRMSTIMREFDSIVNSEAARIHEQTIVSAILDTKREVEPDHNGTAPVALDLHYEKLDWALVCARAPDNKIVIEALATGPALIEAVCIVFYQLRSYEETWSSPRVHTEIRRLAKRLADIPALMERVMEEYVSDEG